MVAACCRFRRRKALATMMTASLPLKPVQFGGCVRFRLPEDWVEKEEDGLAVFHPKALDRGTLRVAIREIPCDTAGPDVDPEELARLAMNQAALQFVRPDDARASDRGIENLPGGDVLAHYTIATNEAGERLRHYLWMRGTADRDRAVLAMFSYVILSEQDGREPWTSTVALLDREIRTASVGRPAEPAD